MPCKDVGYEYIFFDISSVVKDYSISRSYRRNASKAMTQLYWLSYVHPRKCLRGLFYLYFVRLI